MALILAVDPDGQQRAALARLARELDGHELLARQSCADALAVVDSRAPDIVLLSLFVSEADETELLSQVRARAPGRDVPVLTIPLLTGTQAAADVGEACEPRVFADRIREYLPSPDDDEADGDALVEPPAVPEAAPPAEPAEVDLAHALEQDRRRRVLAAAHAAASWARARQAAWDTPFEREPTSSAGPDEAVEAAAPDAAPAAAAPITVPPEPTAPAADLPRVATPPRAAAVEAAGPAVASRKPKRGPSVAARLLRGAGALGPPVRRWLPRLAVAAVLVAGALAAGSYVMKIMAAPKTGVVVFQAIPEATEVVVDGKTIGSTPTTATLPAGEHRIEYRYRAATRTAAITVPSGGRIVENVDWTRKPTGRLSVSSDPPGARVLVDGTARGVTPLTLADLTAGSHVVVLESTEGSVRRTVAITADATAQLSETIFSGWVGILAPFDVVVTEGRRAIRLDERHQAMLPPGPHDLRLENRTLGFAEVRHVEVQPGELTSLSIVPPHSALTVTSTAQAEVTVDGVSLGQTPLTGAPIDLGTREIVVRSATGEERRFTVTVTVKPVTLNVEFSSPTR